MPEAKVPYTNGQPLTMDQLRMVMQWIDEGAKNDNGQVAFSNITGKAFITNQASDYVAVVDLDNFFLTRYVQVGPGGTQLAAPHNVFVDYQNKYFYVTLIAGHIVDKYDATTYEKIGSINFVYSPAHVIINHAGTKGFVTDYDLRQVERQVKSFDPATMTEMNTISDITMNATHGEKITQDDRFLVTVAYLGEYAYVINAAKDSIETMLPVDPQVPPNGNGTGFFRPIAVSLSPDDHYAFVTCASSNDVRVLDMTTRAFIRTIPVGIFPIQSECSPDGHWLYVADRNSNAVTVIDISTLQPVKTILGVGAQPHGVAFTKDGHYAFVSCESVGGTFVHHPVTGSTRPGTTAVIDAWNGHVKVKDIEMASFPAGVSIVH
jgi:YVTN family beta-propeller protein